MTEPGNSAKEHPLLEAFLENVEAGVDLITASDVLAAVPVVGTAFKVLRGVNDIRARAFMAKLAAFVTDPSLQSDASKDALRKAAISGNEESRKIGETLFLVLERLTDLDKPTLLARVLASHLANVISAEELRRLAPAIDAAFVEGIKKLAAASEPVDENASAWMRPLVVAGLTEQGVSGPVGGRLVFRLTPLGHSMRRALAESGRTAT
jgi:hypothetical protein